MHGLRHVHVHVPWRTLQTTINVSTIVASFCTFLPLGYVSSYFSWQCVMFADIKLRSVNSTAIMVDKERTVWGSTPTCYFTTYTPMFVGIHAFIWCWFFLLMKEQLKSDKKEFPLLVFSFLLHGAVCIEMFVVSSMITSGIDTWCRNLVRAIHDKNFMLSCPETQTLDWPNVYPDNKKHPIYSFLFTAKVSSWIQTLTILIQVLVCGYKIYCWILRNTNSQLGLEKCLPRSNSLVTNQSFEMDNDGYSIETGDYRRLSETEST